MLEPHYRALEKRIKENAPLVNLIDLWNNQSTDANWTKDKQILPAVFIEFMPVQWKNSTDKVQWGRVVINFHCAQKNIRETNDKAEDKTSKRLNRFDLPNAVAPALNNFSVKDVDGNYIIKSLYLESTVFDNNHDTLITDTITMSAQIFFYDTWREKNWKEIIIQTVEDVEDKTIVI